MAIIQGSFYSETLYKLVNYTAVLPEKAYSAVNCMYVLHGRSGNCSSWINQTGISRYSADVPLVLFFPEVDLSYYTNMAVGGNYWDFLTQEFPQKMNQFHPYKYQKQFLCGNSMGGYGALKWLLAEQNRFDFIGLLSPLVDVRRLLTEFPETTIEFQAAFTSCEQYEQSTHDLLAQLDKQQSQLPEILHLCGKNDFLYTDNLLLQEKLCRVSKNYQFIVDEGDHDWTTWDKGIFCIINYLKERGEALWPMQLD